MITAFSNGKSSHMIFSVRFRVTGLSGSNPVAKEGV